MFIRAYITDDAVKMQAGIASLFVLNVFLLCRNPFTWRLDTVNFGRHKFGGVLLSDLLREIKLENGLVVTFFDMTSHYYGGFFHVAIMADIELQLSPEVCPAGQSYEELTLSLGNKVRHQKKLERMGVENEEVGLVRNSLIDKFMETLSTYLYDPAFPARLVSAEAAKLIKNNININSPLRFSGE
jgi:hypothetical protein